MNHWLTVCLCVGLLAGCGKSTTELGAEPANLIDAAKMADILTEVHLSEARVSKLGIASTDSGAIVFKRLQASTLKKFGVDTSAYTQSYIYYSARPAELAKVYEKVVETLKEREKKASAKAGGKRPIPAS